jgi:glycosyltransferase involved in cell wall biosynthesis
VDLGWLRALRAVIRRERVDLVNAHAPVPGFADVAARASRAESVPFVLTYHSGPMRKGHVVLDQLLRCYEQVVLPRTSAGAAQIICSSRFVADAFPRAFAAAVPIPPGVDLADFPDGGSSDPGLLLFVASLEHATAYKGLADLLHALVEVQEAHPGVRLEVAGDGDARSHYAALAGRLGIGARVAFLGNLDRTRLSAAYRRAGLVVLPTRYDSFPTVLVEAMASGRPVLSTTVGGIPSLVDDGVDGRLIEPGDPGGLADAVTAMLDDPARLERMGAAGRVKVAAGLTWDQQTARTVAVYRRALNDASVPDAATTDAP